MKKPPLENIIVTEGDAKIIKVRHTLREKVGFGGLDPLTLERAEEFIQNNYVDYNPYAREFLDALTLAIKDVKAKQQYGRSGIIQISRPVMALKASGAMFHYALISDICDIVLNFLEGLEKIDDDTIDILSVLRRSLIVIIDNRMTGDGGPTGKALSAEIYSACDRYMAKHGKN